MAPSQKRKPIEDDFIHTIDDDDDLPVEEEEVSAQPPKKKAKTSKGSKKSKRAATPEDDEEEVAEGIWGQNDDDDGAMDSDFEFGGEDAEDVGVEEFEGWGFDGAKKGMNADKKGVDLDEIIRRRREKKLGKSADKDAEEDADQAEVDANEMEVDLDDEDDEVLADDAFGMNVASDAEESGEEEEDDEDKSENEAEDDDDDEAASDNDSVATPVGHPDDDVSDQSDDEEDAEEEEKRKAFFAPEEQAKPGKKSDVSSFQAMSLSRPILRGLASVGFTKPTPIQSKSIPIALMGKDLVGGAVTGSGKTGAFIVPILERLLYRPKKIPTTRVVVLTPTRELAIQCHAVATKLAAYTDIKFTLAVGGLSLKVQEAELRLRPDVIIATPGRFIDHMRNSASFNVDTVEILILDEADRMLEDGFADELNEILTTLPKSRQTMLFSATMTSTVDRLIRVGMNKPARVMVDSQKKTVGTLVQEFVRLRPGREEKRMGYLAYICKTLYTERVIIFFRQKKEAHRARIIFGLLGLSCAELHGSMNQTQVSIISSITVPNANKMHSVSQVWKSSEMAKCRICWPPILLLVVWISRVSTPSSTTKPLSRSRSTSTESVVLPELVARVPPLLWPPSPIARSSRPLSRLPRPRVPRSSAEPSKLRKPTSSRTRLMRWTTRSMRSCRRRRRRSTSPMSRCR